MSERDSGSGRGEGLTRAVANRDAKTQLSEVDHAPWPAAARLAPTAFKRPSVVQVRQTDRQVRTDPQCFFVVVLLVIPTAVATLGGR